MLTTAACLTLRTISPWHLQIPSCMCQYGNQHQLSPKLLKSKGLLSYLIEDGRAEGGFRLIDTLEFAWLLGFGSLKWPRDLCTAYRLLGNGVAPIHARIVNGWISTFWLKESFCFQALWDEFRKFDESISKLADFLFFQNDEWIWWASPSGTYDLQPIPIECIQVTVFAGNQRFECKVPFVHGLTTRQILAALYPCNWNKISLSFHSGERLQDICVEVSASRFLIPVSLSKELGGFKLHLFNLSDWSLKRS